MNRDSTVVAFHHPEDVDDPLTLVLRDGARRLLAEAIEAEAEAFLVAMQEQRLADGRARLVRHGHGPERLVQTGIGPVPVRGLTPHGASGAIAAKLAAYMRSPNVTVEIDAYRPFFIQGAVRAAGQFTYVPGMTVRAAVKVVSIVAIAVIAAHVAHATTKLVKEHNHG